MKKNEFTLCATKYIARLRVEGRHSTAHVYANALRSFTMFCGTPSVSFRQIHRESLKRYARYLTEAHCKLNTVSTYMRMLRCIYNQGIDAGKAPYIHRLFRDVFTGVDTQQKKALPIEALHTLLFVDPKSKRLRKTQSIAQLLFLFSGMSFADLAHLEKKNLERGILKYNRIKTGTPMCVEVLPTARELIQLLRNKKTSPTQPDAPDYLFNILSGEKKKKELQGYREYQAALRNFNNQLKKLAKACHIPLPVTSYSLRHSWATTAKYRKVPVEMISESLGHKSIKTTQIYLKGFELEERTEINKLNCCYVKDFHQIKMNS
ncbi:MAG: site-specific integrase [Kiritimatiellia bacterium]